jgi:hypothetical protein
VFLVFLYQVNKFLTSTSKYRCLSFILQRWIYRIDPTRVNEFGQVMVPEENVKEESKKDK